MHQLRVGNDVSFNSYNAYLGRWKEVPMQFFKNLGFASFCSSAQMWVVSLTQTLSVDYAL